jgi:indole-3-glycerol phosphate synthase
MNKLQEICERKLQHIKQKKLQTPSLDLSNIEPTRGFRKALENSTTGIIAEYKRASPSKGIIRADLTVSDVAKAYQNGGAVCMSVLTDEPYFMGKDEDLILARNSCSLPLLRKDFMLDVYQVEEARKLGADCILIIIAAMQGNMANDLYQAALSLDMDVLAEIHEESELQAALDLPEAIIGINNRSLKTLEVDVNTCIRISKQIPDNRIKVAESGIAGREDILKIKNAGINNFLIGETLMRYSNPEEGLRELT